MSLNPVNNNVPIDKFMVSVKGKVPTLMTSVAGF